MKDERKRKELASPAVVCGQSDPLAWAPSPSVAHGLICRRDDGTDSTGLWKQLMAWPSLWSAVRLIICLPSN